MKKVISSLLALSLIFSVTAVLAEDCTGCNQDNYNQLIKKGKGLPQVPPSRY